MSLKKTFLEVNLRREESVEAKIYVCGGIVKYVQKVVLAYLCVFFLPERKFKWRYPTKYFTFMVPYLHQFSAVGQKMNFLVLF